MRQLTQGERTRLRQIADTATDHEVSVPSDALRQLLKEYEQAERGDTTADLEARLQAMEEERNQWKQRYLETKAILDPIESSLVKFADQADTLREALNTAYPLIAELAYNLVTYDLAYQARRRLRGDGG